MALCRASLNMDNSMVVRPSSGLPAPGGPPRMPGSRCAKQTEEERSSNPAITPWADDRVMCEFKVRTPVGVVIPGRHYGARQREGRRRLYGLRPAGVTSSCDV